MVSLWARNCWLRPTKQQVDVWVLPFQTELSPQICYKMVCVSRGPPSFLPDDCVPFDDDFLSEEENDDDEVPMAINSTCPSVTFTYPPTGNILKKMVMVRNQRASKRVPSSIPREIVSDDKFQTSQSQVIRFVMYVTQHLVIRVKVTSYRYVTKWTPIQFKFTSS